ncbi:MAG TPA: MFS transporter [Candidatus Omnitrophota bacterium]|nr:MFS transporter [Candidatus Omnitrophota bacterium]
MGCIAISFNIAAIAAVIPVISKELGLVDFETSRVIPYYMVPYGFGALIYAPLTRFISYRTVMAGTMMLFAAMSFVCGFAQSLEIILAARVMMGIAAASAIPIGLMVIGELFEKQLRGRLVAGFFSSAFIASSVGIAVSGVIHWRWLFYIPGLFAAFLAIGFLLFGSEFLRCRHIGHINYLRLLQNLEARNVCILIFVLSFLYHGVANWYGIYLSRIYHLSQLTISGCFIVTALGGMFGQLMGGVITDRKGRLFACRTGVLILSAGTMLLAGTYPLMVLCLVLLLISTGWTVGHNGLSTTLTDFPDEDRPMVASMNSFVRFFSGGIGFSASAYFVERSFSATFFIIGVLMLMTSLFITKLIPR